MQIIATEKCLCHTRRRVGFRNSFHCAAVIAQWSTVASAESIKSLLAAAEGAAELHVVVVDAATAESIKPLLLGLDAVLGN